MESMKNKVLCKTYRTEPDGEKVVDHYSLMVSSLSEVIIHIDNRDNCDSDVIFDSELEYEGSPVIIKRDGMWFMRMCK